MVEFVGTYWCCGGPSLIVDVEKAVDHYVKKFGEMPEYCYVGDRVELPKNWEVDGVKVLCNERAVLKGHLWVGCYEETD